MHAVLFTAAGQRLLKEALSTIEIVQAGLPQPLDEESEEDLQQTLQTVRSGFVRGSAPTAYGINDWGPTDTSPTPRDASPAT